MLIQRETGGNLAEILDNLANVVRERFKIRRQVRVHTAHGRFTGYVLMALPAFLAVALMFINPEHMNLLFEERIGQMMILGLHRDAGDRVHLDQTNREDRGVTVTMLLPFLAFVFGSLLVTAVTYALTARSAGLNARLRDVVGGGAQAEAPYPTQSNEQAIAFFKRIGERAPQSPKELGKLRLRLIQAGYRGGEALFVFLGIRVAFALGCFAIFMTPLVRASESV